MVKIFVSYLGIKLKVSIGVHNRRLWGISIAILINHRWVGFVDKDTELVVVEPIWSSELTNDCAIPQNLLLNFLLWYRVLDL